VRDLNDRCYFPASVVWKPLILRDLSAPAIVTDYNDTGVMLRICSFWTTGALEEIVPQGTIEAAVL
jgi:hypothetical protein